MNSIQLDNTCIQFHWKRHWNIKIWSWTINFWKKRGGAGRGVGVRILVFYDTCGRLGNVAWFTVHINYEIMHCIAMWGWPDTDMSRARVYELRINPGRTDTCAGYDHLHVPKLIRLKSRRNVINWRGYKNHRRKINRTENAEYLSYTYECFSILMVHFLKF